MQYSCIHQNPPQAPPEFCLWLLVSAGVSDVCTGEGGDNCGEGGDIGSECGIIFNELCQHGALGSCGCSQLIKIAIKPCKGVLV